MIHIIGAGPAGLYLGWKLKELNPNLEVTIYEEHEKIGEPIQCTGLVTSKINDYVKIPKSVIANKISKAKIFAPNGTFVEINLSDPDLVIHRNKFDQHLAKKATKAGCDIKKGSGLTRIEKGILVFKKTKVILKPGDIVVGSDGPKSLVAEHLGVKHDLLSGIQAIMKIKNSSIIKFYPYIGEYAWVVPEDKGTARVGVVAREDCKKIFDEFVSGFKGQTVDIQAGTIPMHKPSLRIHKTVDGVAWFIVGDAAGQVKNTTGGGIIPGLRSAEKLARAIVSKEYWTYVITCQIQPDLVAHQLMNRAFSKFSDKDWNELIDEFKSKELKEVLANTDRENALSMIFKILSKKPRFIKYGEKAF
ncbi:MAG: geranylgeranyl reductase family protein [Nanoarchaeota archaeon]|nr:geranylgeranyl reductase family protein [Nanoarchaeota archaeon]